jgi:hypothetical protein
VVNHQPKNVNRAWVRLRVRAATRILALGSTLFLLVACDPEQPGTNRTLTLPELDVEVLISEQNKRLARAAKSSKDLENAINAFISDPKPALREASQSHWLAAHRHYLGTTVMQEAHPTTRDNVDLWPIQIGFVDALPEYPNSGIVSDESLIINEETLRNQHQMTADEEASLGFHVLEHYLFDRSLADFTVSSPNSERRREYVNLAARLLAADLARYAEDPNDDNAALTPESFPAMVSLLQKKMQQLFSEINQQGQHTSGGPASNGRSTQDILSQLREINNLLGAPVELNHYLLALDPTAAQVFNETLEELLHLLPETEQPDDENISRVLLLTSALSHQLDDFKKASASQG